MNNLYEQIFIKTYTAYTIFLFIPFCIYLDTHYMLNNIGEIT